MPSDPQTQWELNYRAANLAHERFYATGNQAFQSVMGFADAALKSSAILNGGAAVATLTFIGALLTAPNRDLVAFAPLIDVLMLFGVGVLLASAATAASYFSQYAYSEMGSAQELTWQHPYVVDTPESNRIERTGDVLRYVAILLVTASYVAFVVGGLAFRDFATVSFLEAGASPALPQANLGSAEMASDNAYLIVAFSSIAAAIVGPVAAVMITLWWESKRQVREGKQLVLQTLLATRGRYGDPGYSWAIQTTALHFAGSKGVMMAHSEYMKAVRFEPTAENQQRHEAEIGRCQGVLISEMLKDLGYKGLTSEQIETYTARGLADREELLLHALRALPHIAISAKRSADSAEEMLKHMRGGAIDA